MPPSSTSSSHSPAPAAQPGSPAPPLQEVLREFPDVRLAYGESDEYSFVLHPQAALYGGCVTRGHAMPRRASQKMPVIHDAHRCTLHTAHRPVLLLLLPHAHAACNLHWHFNLAWQDMPVLCSSCVSAAASPAEPACDTGTVDELHWYACCWMATGMHCSVA
jgi:hypothetical protein